MTLTSTAPVEAGHAFDAALAGAATCLELADGRRLPLPVQRWHDRANGADRWLLDRCHGPTIDLGCGPGRLVEALLDRGHPALGVDHSTRAVRSCVDRGAPVLQRDVFAPLPAEGRWRHVLLADGNIGIGGEPVPLLRRAAGLLAAGGSLLIETAPPPVGLWRGTARLYGPHRLTGPWFPWALVGATALPDLAHVAGLRVADTVRCRRRYFAQLKLLDW